jgi:hypothetical protein
MDMPWPSFGPTQPHNDVSSARQQARYGSARVALSLQACRFWEEGALAYLAMSR